MTSWNEAASEDGVASAVRSIDAIAQGEERLDEAAKMYPLSTLQQGIWFEHHLNLERAPYNVGVAQRIRGPLRLSVLDAAWQAVVRRHAALRTYIRRVNNDEVCQVVMPAVSHRFEASADVQGDYDEAVRLGRLVVREPYDFERAMPWRATAIRIAPEDHLLVFAFHHIICDQQSVAIVLRELSACYNAVLERRDPDLPPAGLPHDEWAESPSDVERSSEDARAYWAQRFATMPPPLSLPRSVLVDNESAPDRVTAPPIPFSALRPMESLQHRARATQAMILLSAYQALLSRITGQDDIVVGLPTSSRAALESTPTIGFFVNLLPIRTHVARDMTFAAVVEQTRTRVVEALTHRSVPISEIVSRVAPGRYAGGSNPLLQAVFGSQQQGASPRLELAGTTCEPASLNIQTWRAELVLLSEAMSAGLRTTFEFNRNRFATGVVEEWLEGFDTLLRAAVADPSRTIGRLPLFSAEAQARVRARSVGETDRTVRSLSIRDVVDAASTRYADRLAVEDGAGRALSYGALRRASDRLARRLRQHGVGVEDCVAVLIPRSNAFVVAALAAWKVGAAYLPLSLDMPHDRCRLLIADAKAKVLLTADDATGLPDVPDVFVEQVSNSDVHDDRSSEHVDTSWPAVAPEQAAYVMYTSGSSGVPKGVVVTHGALANYVTWAARYYRAADGDGSPLHSSLSFDLSLTSLWCPLVAGRKVTFIAESRGTARNALEVDALGALLSVTTDQSILKLTPSHLQMLALSSRFTEVARWPRCFVVGGEQLSYDMLAPWRRAAKDTRVVNEYGPTEATVGCCIYEVNESGPDSGPVPIGRPIVNARLYALDPLLEPVMTSATGELYIGGDVTARGYLGQPRATADRFMPDPFADEPGMRMYRTGDLVRHLPDANLEYLGRNDDQVKIRGHRIELLEVEAALRALPSVQDACVVVDRDDPGALLGFVTLAENGDANAGEIRTMLANELPHYMVPSKIAIVDALPVTANGKVDRKAVATAACVPSRTAASARNQTETRLLAIWRDVLGEQAVSTTDNFFDLGGHSLAGERMLARTRREFGKNVRLSDFLSDPTIRHLATLVDSPGRNGALRGLFLLKPGGTPPLVLIPAVGDVHTFGPLAAHLGSERSLYAVHAPHPTEIDRYMTLPEIAGAYADSIVKAIPRGPVGLAGYSFGSAVAFEVAHQLQDRGRDVGFLGLIDGGTPEFVRRADGRSDVERFAGIARDLARTKGVDLDLSHEYVSTLNGGNGAMEILLKLQRAGVIERTADDAGWLERFMRGLSWMLRALREYVPRPYTESVTFFRARLVESESAKAWAAAGVDVMAHDKGWSRVCTRPLDIRWIQGYHATLLKEPNVRLLAAEIRSALTRTSAASLVDAQQSEHHAPVVN